MKACLGPLPTLFCYADAKHYTCIVFLPTYQESYWLSSVPSISIPGQTVEELSLLLLSTIGVTPWFVLILFSNNPYTPLYSTPYVSPINRVLGAYLYINPGIDVTQWIHAISPKRTPFRELFRQDGIKAPVSTPPLSTFLYSEIILQDGYLARYCRYGELTSCVSLDDLVTSQSSVLRRVYVVEYVKENINQANRYGWIFSRLWGS